jgi:hypothetical protein
MSKHGKFQEFGGQPIGGRVPTRIVTDSKKGQMTIEDYSLLQFELDRFRTAVRLTAFPNGFHRHRVTMVNGTEVVMLSINGVETAVVSPGSVERPDPIRLLPGIGICLTELDGRTPIDSPKYTILSNTVTEPNRPQPLIVRPQAQYGEGSDFTLTGFWKIEKADILLGGTRMWGHQSRKWWFSVIVGHTFGQPFRPYFSSTTWPPRPYWEYDRYWDRHRVNPDWIEMDTKSLAADNPGGVAPEDYLTVVTDSKYVFRGNFTHCLFDSTNDPLLSDWQLPPFYSPDAMGIPRLLGLVLLSGDRIGVVQINKIPELELEKPNKTADVRGAGQIDLSNPTVDSPGLVGIIDKPAGVSRLQPTSIDISPLGDEIIASFREDPTKDYPLKLYSWKLSDFSATELAVPRINRIWRGLEHGGSFSQHVVRDFKPIYEWFPEPYYTTTCAGAPVTLTRDYGPFQSGFSAPRIDTFTWSFQKQYGGTDPVLSHNHDKTLFRFDGEKINISLKAVNSFVSEANGYSRDQVTYASRFASATEIADGWGRHHNRGINESRLVFSTGWEFLYFARNEEATYYVTRTGARTYGQTETAWQFMASLQSSYDYIRNEVQYYDADWDVLVVVEFRAKVVSSIEKDIAQVNSYSVDDIDFEIRAETLKIIQGGVEVFSEVVSAGEDMNAYKGFAAGSPYIMDFGTWFRAITYGINYQSTGWIGVQNPPLSPTATDPLNLITSSTTQQLTPQTTTYNDVINSGCPAGSSEVFVAVQDIKTATYNDTLTTTSVVLPNRYPSISNSVMNRLDSGIDATAVGHEHAYSCRFAKDPATRTTIVNVVLHDHDFAEPEGEPPALDSWLFVIDKDGVKKLQDVDYFSDLPEDARIWYKYDASSLVSI